jgi:hypothetical protein
MQIETEAAAAQEERVPQMTQQRGLQILLSEGVGAARLTSAAPNVPVKPLRSASPW